MNIIKNYLQNIKKYIQDKVELLFNKNFLNNKFQFYPNYINNIKIKNQKTTDNKIVELFKDYEVKYFENKTCTNKIKLTSDVKKNNNKNKNICLGRKLGSGGFAIVYEYDKNKVLRLADLTSLTDDFDIKREKDGNINQYKLTQLCPILCVNYMIMEIIKIMKIKYMVLWKKDYLSFNY